MFGFTSDLGNAELAIGRAIDYGNDAHPEIENEELSLTPYESADGTITWRCGNAPKPYGSSGDLDEMGSAYGGSQAVYNAPTMQDIYLPFECRFLP